jgi:hypothetical protein
MSLLDQPEVPLIEPTKTFSIDNEVDGLNIVVAWQSKQVGIPCDLDLNVLVFDERVCRTSYLYSLFHILYRLVLLNELTQQTGYLKMPVAL